MLSPIWGMMTSTAMALSYTSRVELAAP